MIAIGAGGITRSQRLSQSGRGRSRPQGTVHERGRPADLEFANLPHDFAETLELVFVGITIVASLAIMVAFGHWWQR